MNINELVGSVQSKTAEIQKKITEETSKLQDYCKEQFTVVASALFKEFPKLKSFSWTQYTPYFNDGDECTFSAHTSDFEVNGLNRYDSKGEDDGEEAENLFENSKKYVYAIIQTEEHIKEHKAYCAENNYANSNISIGARGYIKNVNYNPEHGQIIELISTLLTSMDEDILKAMFGDHAKITVRASGTEVEEYSHD